MRCSPAPQASWIYDCSCHVPVVEQSCVSSSGKHGSDVVAITALRKPLSLSTRFSLKGSVFDDCFAMTSLAVKVLHSYYAARGFTLTERRQPEGSHEFKAMFADLDKIHWSVMSELQQTARDSRRLGATWGPAVSSAS